MKRKDFIRSAVIGMGALPLSTVLVSCKSNAKTTDSKFIDSEHGIQLNVRGDQQTIKLTGKDTNGQMALIEQNNDPGVGMPEHVHENEDEVFQVLSGKVKVKVGDQTTTLDAGDIIFCPRRIPHSWKVIGDEKAKCMLSIFPAGLEEMFKEVAALPPGPPDPEVIKKIRKKYNIKFV